MAGAGLTHGGFYEQLRVEDDLVAQAITFMFDATHERFGSRSRRIWWVISALFLRFGSSLPVTHAFNVRAIEVPIASFANLSRPPART